MHENNDFNRAFMAAQAASDSDDSPEGLGGFEQKRQTNKSFARKFLPKIFAVIVVGGFLLLLWQSYVGSQIPQQTRSQLAHQTSNPTSPQAPASQDQVAVIADVNKAANDGSEANRIDYAPDNADNNNEQSVSNVSPTPDQEDLFLQQLRKKIADNDANKAIAAEQDPASNPEAAQLTRQPDAVATEVIPASADPVAAATPEITADPDHQVSGPSEPAADYQQPGQLHFQGQLPETTGQSELETVTDAAFLSRVARSLQQTSTTEPYYTIQLAAYNNRPQAEAHWHNLLGNVPELLDGLVPQIAILQQNSGAQLFRLRAGKFQQQDSAKVKCAKLKLAAISCFVVAIR